MCLGLRGGAWEWDVVEGDDWDALEFGPACAFGEGAGDDGDVDADFVGEFEDGVDGAAGGDDVVEEADALADEGGEFLSSEPEFLLVVGGDGVDGDADGILHERLAALADFEEVLHVESGGERLCESAGFGLDGEDGGEVEGLELLGEAVGGGGVPACFAGEVEGVDAEAVADVDEWNFGAAVGSQVDGAGEWPGVHGGCGGLGCNFYFRESLSFSGL